MKDTIEMACEAGILSEFDTAQDIIECGIEVWLSGERGIQTLERFAELIRTDQDEKYKWDVHSCGPTCKRYACVAMREAVEAEREACAKEADKWSKRDDDVGAFIGKAIRARGNT